MTSLSCSLNGKQIALRLTPGTLLARLHRETNPIETDPIETAPVELATCNYGLSPTMQHLASDHGMTVSATDDTGEVRAVERPEHPFFVATLYQPQLRSTPAQPHPILSAFVKAIMR